ncbi:MAG: TetR/AcrR family transcriptional regulator [Chloroflexota bacterium]
MILQVEVDGATERSKRRRRERAARILDAAAVSILRWGYDKTTIDDVARQAGVAKGTIYLHWKTRDDLFRALIRRERLAVAGDLRRRVVEDPEGATLRGMLKHSALALLTRPLMKAILLRDLDVLGKLARREPASATHAEALAALAHYLEFLRERGLMRTDLDLPAQVSTLGAIFMGFFLIAPLLPGEFSLSDEGRAELIAETVHRALEPARAFSPDELAAASRAFLDYLDRETAIVWEASEQENESDPLRSAHGE